MVKHHLKDKNFSGGCVSWYRNAEGVNWTLWPRSVITYSGGEKFVEVLVFYLRITFVSTRAVLVVLPGLRQKTLELQITYGTRLLAINYVAEHRSNLII